MGDIMKNLKKKKGFTLIEVLTAVIILGVVGLIGISAITDYIEMSRKSAFVATANSYIEEVRSLKANDSLVQEPKNTEALLIPISEIEIDGNKNLETPYGNIITEKSYIIIENKNNDFNYYVAILDDTGHAIILENSNKLNVNSIKLESNENSELKEINSIKENLEYVDLDGKLYQVSNNNLENSSTILLDCSILELFTVTVSEEWENNDKNITVKMLNEVEGYKYYISERSSKPLKSDSNWQSDNKFTKDLGTYYVFVQSPEGEISSGKKVIVDKIDKGVPTCTLKATGEMSTEEYFGTDVVISFESYNDITIENSQTSGIKNYGINSSDGNKFVIHAEDNTEGVKYTGYVEDKAGNIGTCSITIKREANWTLTYNNNGGTGCTNKAVVFNNQIGTLCTPTKTGYTFEGWYSESSLTNRITNTTVFKNEYTTLYAKWTVNQYIVTYNANGGSVSPTSKTVTYDTTYGTLPTPTRAGHTFKGWYTLASGGTQVTSTTVVKAESNHTIYAQWTANNYTLSYNNNGGTGCSSKIITYGSTYGTLCTPTRSGYNFLGWYTLASGGTQITSSTVLWSASNQTIYAHWEYVSVPTVIYNGGSNTCTWKNNYNLTLSATAETGISYYEIDVNSDGVADSTTGSNFIPWTGYSSCTVRFRAVSNSGNRSGWTGNHHIHMDTQAPAHTNWWWSEVTRNVARLYIQTSDNIGINRVQCPTSTATGGYGNWYWFNAVWDASANAYRCDITPSTFNHYNQAYITHLYIYDHAGNGGYYNQTSVSIPANTYTIFYNNNGGSGCSSQTATIGSSFGTLCTPVRDGYIFIGWFNANYKDAPLNYYSDLYADLKNAYGYDADKLYNHWVQYGAKEGRRISQYVSTDAASTNITLYAGWYKKPTPTTPSCEEKRECGCCGGRNQHNGYCIRYCCC